MCTAHGVPTCLFCILFCLGPVVLWYSSQGCREPEGPACGARLRKDFQILLFKMAHSGELRVTVGPQMLQGPVISSHSLPPSRQMHFVHRFYISVC